MPGNPTNSKWYSTPASKRRAKPAQFTLTESERTMLGGLKSKHGAALSRIVGAGIAALCDMPKAGAAAEIERAVERVKEQDR